MAAEQVCCYHGWDSSKYETPPLTPQGWAEPTYGHSPEYWGRAQGWYAMALVDCLDIMPTDDPCRPQMLTILSDLAESLLIIRTPTTAPTPTMVCGGRSSTKVILAQPIPQIILKLPALLCSPMPSPRPSKKATFLQTRILLSLGLALRVFVAINSPMTRRIHKPQGYCHRRQPQRQQRQLRLSRGPVAIRCPRVTNDYKGVGAFMRRPPVRKNDSSRINIQNSIQYSIFLLPLPRTF